MKADRIFLDANILFSVAYGSIGLDRLWQFSGRGICELFVSKYVVEEAKRNLDTVSQIKKLNDRLSKVQIIPEADQMLSCHVDLPEKDKPVFMAAVLAKADYVITGDVTHFGKYFGRTIMGVTVCTARDYIQSKVS
jgi:predicted nucleic acid-binding protein